MGSNFVSLCNRTFTWRLVPRHGHHSTFVVPGTWLT
ncbi:hypothetical protein BH11PAT2_BH11PAT2_06120 [soil metagenome]